MIGMSTLLFILIANTSFAAAFSGLKPVIQRIGAHMSSVSLLPSVPSTSSLSDINYGLSDEEFSSWLTNEVAVCPGRTIYSSVYDNAIEAIVEWRKRYRGNPLLWKRIFRKEKVIKELVEVAPVIDVVKSVVEAYDEDENFTIVDLCSGKGYMSMLLSEILPKDKVERIVLVDKAWAIANKETTKELKPHHMNWDHIYGTNPLTEKSYFCSWPIKLYTSKQGKLHLIGRHINEENYFLSVLSRPQAVMQPKTIKETPIFKSKWSDHHPSSASLWNPLLKSSRHV